MDYIDLYIIHRWDYDHPIEETMGALNELVKSKKVRYIGCSALFPYQLFKANEIARKMVGLNLFRYKIIIILFIEKKKEKCFNYLKKKKW